jgi:group I intron endonuclease
MKKSGVYRIENNATGRVYVGSAIDLSGRKRDHWKALRGGYHRNSFLQRAWDKYGEASFSFDVIEYVDEKERLIEREQFFLDQLSFDRSDPNRCYNICPTAGSKLGTNHSKESRARMSAAAIGRILPLEQREKMSKSHKGKIRTAEHRAKLSASRTGFRHTDEAKAKISAAKTGVKQSAEEIEKRAAKLRGVPKSEAHKQSLREVHRSLTAEQVAEIVARRKAGETYVEIAKDYNTTKDTVRNWCLREGGRNRDRVMPEALRQEIFQRRHAGESLRDICKACKVSKQTVVKVYQEGLADYLGDTVKEADDQLALI